MGIIGVDSQSIGLAAETLKNQGVIIYPTETVYGLGGDGLNPAIHQRIGQLKGRPSNKPYLLLVASIEEAEMLAGPFSTHARDLAERFWPGPLTLILPLKRQRKTLGLRISPHPVVREILAIFKRPLISTSANLSGDPPPREVKEISPRICQNVDWILDDGKTHGGRTSTIVDVTGRRPRLLREGPISREDLAQFGVR